MKLVKAHIVGFQSFGDSEDIGLTDGINLIVGQNNAGKSALLRALQADVLDDRHRTPDVWEDFRLPLPKVTHTIQVSGSELRDSVFQIGQLIIPVPEPSSAISYAKSLFEKPEITVTVSHQPGIGFSANYPSHGQFVWNPGQQQICAVVSAQNGDLDFGVQHRSEDTVPAALHDAYRRKMFFFSAERMNVGEFNAQGAGRLAPNAQNLPAVLFTLAGDRGDVFGRLVAHLRDIFPTVGNISIRPVPSSANIEVRVWRQLYT